MATVTVPAPMSLDLKRQFITQLVESSRLLRNYIEHRAKSRGTTRAQWIVLFRLRQQEGLSQVDLAEVMELHPISLVRLLDRLVDQGLLERRPHPTDRRAVTVGITPETHQQVRRTMGMQHARRFEVARSLTTDERKVVTRFLDDLTATTLVSAPPE